MAKRELWIILAIAASLLVTSFAECSKSVALEDLTKRYENVTRLTTDPANDRNPVWSPDGSKIAFVTHETSKGGIDRNIYVIIDVASS